MLEILDKPEFPPLLCMYFRGDSFIFPKSSVVDGEESVDASAGASRRDREGLRDSWSGLCPLGRAASLVYDLWADSVLW